jgi:hypothetical protein
MIIMLMGELSSGVQCEIVSRKYPIGGILGRNDEYISRGAFVIEERIADEFHACSQKF